MKQLNYFLSILLLCGTCKHGFSQNTETGGRVITDKLVSTVLQENKVGLDPDRQIKIYLPPGYANSDKSYPVVYYLTNLFWSPEKMFQDGQIVRLSERGFASGLVKEFIIVAADYSTPAAGSIYENSPVSGRWLDFTANELVPFIDNKFRTIRSRDSRAIVGDFMGGRGALKMAMIHPEIFSVVYALHPVATGMGYLPWSELNLDWKKVMSAKSVADLQGDRIAQIFLSVCQAYLPNLSRPPLYCDFFVELENGTPKTNVQNMIRAKQGFALDETLNVSAANLKTMRGIAFDWGRFDQTQDHVYANREFSRKLEDLDIDFEAEEYRGNPFNKTWTDDGRYYLRVLPFLSRHLVFEPVK